MKVAVVGATGMVGNVMLEVLREQNFPITELIPVASEKSVGNKIQFGGLEFTVVGLETAVSMKPDVAIFSAGGETSLEWAPKFAAVGTFVIDNSSAWRMDPDKKLIVPEINGDSLTENDKIIANPNCSTIQLVLALSPLHKAYGIKWVQIQKHMPGRIDNYIKNRFNASLRKYKTFEQYLEANDRKREKSKKKYKV